MREKIREITKYPVIICFGAVIVVMFALYLILPQQEFSDVENRSLRTRPDITISGLSDGSFMTNFETYTTEQLPFREPLVKVKALINKMTLSCENNGIVRGKDDYLFETTYGLTDQYNKNVAAIKKFAADTDRTMYVAIAPTAPAILNDYVPYGFKTIDQKQELSLLKNRLLENENVRFIDLYETVSGRASAGEQMYYRTDHHWTTDAAYYAYREICTVLSEERDENYGTFEPGGAKVQRVDDFYGTHYAKFKEYDIKPDTLTYYDIPIKTLNKSDGEFDSLYDLDKLKIYDKYAMFMRGNDEIEVVKSQNTTENHSVSELVIFKDSYANCLIPFLTYEYDTITVVDLRYYSESVKTLLENNKNADILLLYNFDFLNEDNHFYRLTS